MIQIYTGVPGAGKTYKMVRDLDEFLKKHEDEGVNIVSNIRGLKLAHIDFMEMLEECLPGREIPISKKIETFFEYEYQKALNESLNGPILYILDECQQYFPASRSKIPNVEDYLQRHRHLGHYLFLATQETKLIHRGVIPLIELEFNVARRSISFFGEMHIRVKSPQSKQIIRTERIMPKKEIFKLYQSFEQEEIKKPKRELYKKFIVPLILLVGASVFFYGRILNPEKREERLGIERPQGGQSPGIPETSPGSSSHPERKEREYQSIQKQPAEEERRRERVFLPVVLAGGRKLTVDPDTQAVVELGRINKRIICVNNGLSCYYDRYEDEVINIVNLEYSPGGLGSVGLFVPGQAWLNFHQAVSGQPIAPRESPGAFISRWPLDETPLPSPR